MNHMKDVAHMLGLELEEEFCYKSSLTGLSKTKFKFTEYYLQYCYEAEYWCNSTFKTICGLLNGEYEVVKLPILDEIEKEYLSCVIKPFRHKIEYFYKCRCGTNDNYEAIVAKCTECGYLELPAFKKNAMYKGMKVGKKYSLEELGL